jgi:hypothetical protein
MFDTEQIIRLTSLSQPTANENMNKAAQYRPQTASNYHNEGATTQ